jgi:hypothetical protein
MLWMRIGVGLMSVLLLGVLWSCSDSDPTGVPDLDRALVLSVVLENVAGDASLVEAVVLLDDMQLATVSAAQPAPRLEMHAELLAPAGTRRLRARILQQTGPDAVYRLSATGSSDGIPRNFGSASGSVSTGSVIEFSFQL